MIAFQQAAGKACDVVVAAALALGAASIAWLPAESAAAVGTTLEAYGISMDPRGLSVAVLVVAALEGAAGADLALNGSHHGPRALCACLLTCLTLFVAAEGMALGWKAHCGCLGLVAEQSTFGALGRNVGLLGVVVAGGALRARRMRAHATPCEGGRAESRQASAQDVSPRRAGPTGRVDPALTADVPAVAEGPARAATVRVASAVSGSAGVRHAAMRYD